MLVYQRVVVKIMGSCPKLTTVLDVSPEVLGSLVSDCNPPENRRSERGRLPKYCVPFSDLLYSFLLEKLLGGFNPPEEYAHQQRPSSQFYG